MPLYNKVIQDVIDEEKREDEGGFFDEGSAFRTGAAIGTEIGLNFLLDTFSFVPPAQYAGGAAINYLAQRIRGGEFNEGEMVASGLASLIPGGAQLKSARRATRFGTSVGKGALSGGIQVTGEKLINEGEFPTFEEFGTATALGGTFGGAFDLAPAAFKGKLGEDVSEIFDDIGNRIDDTSYDMMGKLSRWMIPEDSMFKQGGSVVVPPPGGNNRRIRVPIDGKQTELFDVRDYTNYKTLGDELLARSEGVVPDPTAPNFRQLRKINQQVFRRIQRRISSNAQEAEAAFYSAVAENPEFSYVEHLVAKGDYMDWYWRLSGQDRHASDNVRLLLNDPFKQLKDVVETFGNGTSANNYNGPFLRNANLSKRLVVDVELPKQVLTKQGIPAIAQNEPGNIVIREAGKKVNGKFKKGRVIGKLGDYLDVLVRNESEIIDAMLKEAREGRAILSPLTDRYGRRLAITSREYRGREGRATMQDVRPAVIEKRFKAWRKALIEERLEEIMSNKNNILRVSKSEAEQIINARILEDMEQIRSDYPFLGGRARAVEQSIIDADPSLSSEALITDRPKSSKLARDADIRTKPAPSLSGANLVKVKVKFKNGKTGEVIRRTDRNGNITYHRLGKGKLENREIFNDEFKLIKPADSEQLTLDE